MVDFVFQCVLVKFDAQPRPRRQIDEAVSGDERLFEVALAQRRVLLRDEVGDGGIELDARRQRDRPQGVVRCNGRVIGLGHPGDDVHFVDAARVTEVGLEDGGCAFLQDFAEAPFGEDALAGGDGEVRAPRDVGQHVDVLALHRLLDKHRLVGFQPLDQQFGRLRADGAVEVDRDVGFRPGSRAQTGEVLDGLIDEGFGLHDARRMVLVDAGFEGGEALVHPHFDRRGVAGVLVHADAVAGGAAE